MSRNNRIRGLAALAGLAVTSAAFGQIDVVEPVTGLFEYIGQGNAGDSSLVYMTFSGIALGGVVETAGFDISYADAAGNAIGGVVNITDGVANPSAGLIQQVPGGGDGDNNIESGETWFVNVTSALGGAIPNGAAMISLTFDPGGAPISTPANADGTNAGGTDAIDERVQILTTRSIPSTAFFDGTGASSQMFVTYTTPSVGFVAPNMAVIPFFGSQNVNATGSIAANSVQIGAGGPNDFEFTDGNNFNSATGLAGTTDITAGSFAQPAGTTNVLQWTFDDTGSNLKGGAGWRRAPVGDGPTVRDSSGNLVTDGVLIASQLLPLAVSSVTMLNDTASANPGVLQVVYNRPLNPAAVGNVAFYKDANGVGNSIRLLVNGSATNVTNLDVTAVAFDPAQPTLVRLTVNDAATFSQNMAPDANSVAALGDPNAGSFQMTFDAGVGVVPQASFGATPAFQAAQNSTNAIADGRAPLIVARRTGDSAPDGVLDCYLVQFDKPVQVTSSASLELSINGGINTFPIDLVDSVTGQLPVAVPTIASTTLADNILPIAAGSFSMPDTGSGVSLFSYDANNDGIIEPIEENNSIKVTYDARAKDWDNDNQTSAGGDTNEALPDTAAVGAVTLFINTTSAALVNPLTNTNVPAGAGNITDANNTPFTNFTGPVDVTAPFDAPTPVTFQGAETNDGAAPWALRLCLQPGDNSPDNGNLEPLSDAQQLFEQDLTVGNQKQNDLVRIVTGENLAPGIDTVTVTENLFSYGNQGDTFGGDNNDNGNDDFLNNNSDGFNPVNANVACWRPLNATDPNAVVPGVSMTLTADTFGRGIRDAVSNQTVFTGMTLDDCGAIYVPSILDSNNIVQAGVFLTPDASGDFVAGMSGIADQEVDATTLQAADFTTNFGATIASVGVNANDPMRIDWTLGGAQVGINNTMTLTYNGASPTAKLVASVPPPDGTGVPVSPVVSTALDGTGANAVRKLQDPWQNATDVAVLPVVINGIGLDGDPLPINSKVIAFNAIPIVREISADYNNIPFTYRTDDHNYNNDTPTGVNPILFSHVYPSLNAFTNWLQGVRSDVYLHRQANNAVIFTNTRTNPYNQSTGYFGDTKADNSTLVDSVYVKINGSRVTNLSFSGTGETNADRIRTGRLDLAWDVIRSFNGTLDNYYRFGYAWGVQPVPAGIGVVDNDLGRVDMHVSRPISQFGATNRFDSIAKPLIFVIELPNGDRYAMSSVLAASNINDHDGDGSVGDPILFEPEVFRNLNSDKTAPNGLTLNFDLRRTGSHMVQPEWNFIPMDRAGGVVAQSNSNLPALPAGVTTSNIVNYNTAQFPYASPLSAGVFWAEAGGGFNGLGNPLIAAYDNKWTLADDPFGPYSSIGLDPDLINHFAFTITTKGVQLNSGINSAVGGYGVAFYNNADLAGGSRLSTFGVFEFGTKLSQASVFASNPINSGNSRAANGWILGTVTNPFDPATGFFGSNSGSDYLIAFRNLGRNPATGNFTVLIDVSSLDSAGGTGNPNNTTEVGVGGSEALLFHLN